MAKVLYVKELNENKISELENLINNAKYDVAQRAKIILLSNEKYTPKEIAIRVNLHYQNVIKWIHRYNEKGILGLYHGNKFKKPRLKYDKEVKNKIVSIATSRPRELGLPFTTWSLGKLQSYLHQKKIASGICIETIRTILNEAGITFKKSKEWLISTDPDYEVKKNKIISLYQNPPEDGVVICFDEKGTIAVKDYAGSKWSKEVNRVAIRQKIKGTTELFAAYNPHRDEITVQFYKKNR